MYDKVWSTLVPTLTNASLSSVSVDTGCEETEELPCGGFGIFPGL